MERRCTNVIEKYRRQPNLNETSTLCGKRDGGGVVKGSERPREAPLARVGLNEAARGGVGVGDNPRAAARRHSGGREGMRTEHSSVVAIAGRPCSCVCDTRVRGADFPLTLSSPRGPSASPPDAEILH